MYPEICCVTRLEKPIFCRRMKNSMGISSVSFEISGSGSYGALKHETGVHRLCACRPQFCGQAANQLFASSKCCPNCPDQGDLHIPETDIEVTGRALGRARRAECEQTRHRRAHDSLADRIFGARHLGAAPKRRTAKRRSKMIRGKLYRMREEAADKNRGDFPRALRSRSNGEARSAQYVLHPYQDGQRPSHRP